MDDDPDYGALVQIACSKRGVSATIASDPAVVLEAFEHERPELCLVDLDMSDQHGVRWRFAGVSTILEMRKRFGPDPAIWILTGNDTPELVSACRKAGADGFISKKEPIDRIADRIRAGVRREGFEAAPAPVSSA